MRNTQFKFFYLILIISSINLYSQNNIQNSINKGTASKIEETRIITRAGKEFTLNNSIDEEIEVIVEFNEPPLFSSKKNFLYKSLTPSFYQKRFSQFENDIKNNILKKRNSKGTHPIEITSNFYKTFFGSTVKISRSSLSQLTKLPYVKQVHIAKTIQAFIKEGTTIIKVDKLKANFGINGSGIKIGIIDTGIDYLHPFLGGGFGEGFTVSGGYDFIDDDNDPMDLNSHGTHVAGIIAGKSETTEGVAFGASLYALRVLDSEGKGTEEDLIRAIEYAADPNNDGNSDDKLDVLNLSLGSNSGSPTDASCRAVNTISDMGVIVCVAAGNAGGFSSNTNPYFFSIRSPGLAKNAITVGATSKQDKRAYFSSNGPADISYDIKPDLMAPGVDILSSVLNNNYAPNSGTSMATPFVTGVAALLKKSHPNWTQTQIKSALMLTANDLGKEAMQQGTGRIDAESANQNNIFTFPHSINYGADTVLSDYWNKSKSLKIYNHGNESKSFNLSFTGNIPGINCSASQQTFTIASNDSVEVILSISVHICPKYF